MKMSFGKLIKKYRIEKDMTQEQLAHAMGYKSTASVNKIETSDKIPTMRIVDKYAVALGTDGYTLLSQIDNAPMDKWYRYSEKHCAVELEIEECADERMGNGFKEIHKEETENKDANIDSNDIIYDESYFYFLMEGLTDEHRREIYRMVSKFHKEDVK